MPELTDSNRLQQRILEESKKYVATSPSENEFTRNRFMELNNIDNKDRAYDILAKMEKDGLIYKRKGRLNGSSCNVYGFKELE